MDSKLTQRQSKHEIAFSLVEVMVAVGLLTVIIIALLAMFYQTQRAFRGGLTQIDVLENGRAALQLISREMREMAAAGEPGVTNFNFALVRKSTLDSPASGFRYMINDLTFLRRVNDDWIGTVYKVAQPEYGAGILHRFTTNVVRTNVVALDRFLGTVVPGVGGFNRIVDGVVHFEVFAYDQSGNLIPQPEPQGGYLFSSNDLPAYIDLELGLLEPKSFEQFRIRAEKSQADGLRYLTNQWVAGRVHLFKDRIAIHNRSFAPFLTNSLSSTN
jgi:type II secretory pathway pseudopilin PulG